ncbi:SDR family NAD(P)-dependent oxidoreductase [Hyalangium rubrum]|uniref:SDR family oxidoreductase n=1 Tax=Hyalangium rubrum TaxID=3103134 RepID=A0ABU5H4F4_9BACT|nr:SDR family oxidoreductase [Hyalangium sp. s54d21]MDY7228191.1 SDR family oxidoreductase [Hyalangium sp. s54d21]
MTAIVTGAGRGIGAATAKRLAAGGMRVGVVDIREEEAAQVAADITREGGSALSLRGDVSVREDVERVIATLEQRWTTPLVLVNNAGVGGPFHRVDEVSDKEWDWIIGTNLRSVFLFTRDLLPKMKQQGFGRIVNVASIQGLLGSAHSSTYVASKHGMIGYTKTIAAEWGPYGITCNAICPGYVDTALGVQPDAIADYMKRVMAKSPVKRTAQPDEVAALIEHLVGPHSGYINGASYTIDGGISAHVGITDDLEGS